MEKALRIIEEGQKEGKIPVENADELFLVAKTKLFQSRATMKDRTTKVRGADLPLEGALHDRARECSLEFPDCLGALLELTRHGCHRRGCRLRDPTRLVVRVFRLIIYL